MKTRKIIIIAIAVLSLFAVSCNEVDKLLTFSISDEATFTINSGLPAGIPFNAATPDVVTNSSAEFKNNNTDINLVKDVKLKEIKFLVS